MPAYPWLATNAADRRGDIEARMRTLQKLGHPYSDDDISGAAAQLEGRTEMDAIIAYLQVLGTFGNGETAP
jgi:cytochrome c oxidase cbb3-type subunit 2